MNKIKDFLTENKNPLLLIIILLTVILVMIMSYYGYVKMRDSINDSKPKLINSETLNDSNALAKAIKVSPITATQIEREIDRTKKPIASYYIQSPNIVKAAEQSQESIKNNDPNLPQIATMKSDRTIVTPNEEQQKVDVYKINLNKAHKVNGGATVIDNKAYATIGYQAGRIEGLLHTDFTGIKGGTILYTMKEW